MASQAHVLQMSTQGEISHLLRLPPEILSLIVSVLTNRDRKSLRQTCYRLSEITPLRLSRVFLSANPLDIQVFRAIADHPKFRQQITEIVWDDARFMPKPAPSAEEEWPFTGEREHLEIDPDNSPTWFVEACEDNVVFIWQRKKLDSDETNTARMDQVKARMSLQDCWKHYQKLLQQQNQIIASRSDEDAFKYGLRQFSALRRVTVTPAAHGWLFTPLYETPTIRALPYGFNYPMPRGWPTNSFWGDRQDPIRWSEATEEYKEQWHGVRIVLRVLAQQAHNVTELNFDTWSLNTGIDYMMFDRSCDEYDHFVAIMKRPGFSHLDLPLRMEEPGGVEWIGLEDGNLHQALSNAQGLTHINFSTTVEYEPWEESISLKKILPVEKWPSLRHFGLSRFRVTRPDFSDLLISLPRTLRSVELVFFEFSRDLSRWFDLLGDMREELNWPRRDDPMRPNVIVAMESFEGHEMMISRSFALEDEVDDFLELLGVPNDWRERTNLIISSV